MIFFACATLGLSLVVALAIVEVVLRVFSLAPSAGISTVTESEFRRVPGIFGPGQQIIDRQIPALPFAVRIDSLGYRGADFPRQKPAGELRIMAVGDSFTYGDYVDDDASLPAVVERQLTQACSRPVRVVNAGVGGSTITTAVHMVERGWDVSPDAVVLIFSENDIDDLRSDMWNELAVNRSAKSRFPLSVAYPVLRRLALWNFALKMRGRVRTLGFAPTPTAPVASHVKSDVDSLRARYSRVLQAIQNDVRSHGRPFVLVAFPSHLTVTHTLDDEQMQWVERMATQQGVPSLSLLGPLRDTGLPTEQLYQLPYDGHASPRGNQLAGDWVAGRLAALGLCKA
jgi:hypothetical protein